MTHTYLVEYYSNDSRLQSLGQNEQVATISAQTESEASCNFQRMYSGKFTTIKNIKLLS